MDPSITPTFPLMEDNIPNFFLCPLLLLLMIVFTNKDTDKTICISPDQLCRPFKTSGEDVNLPVSKYTCTSDMFVLPIGKVGGEHGGPLNAAGSKGTLEWVLIRG